MRGLRCCKALERLIYSFIGDLNCSRNFRIGIGVSAWPNTLGD